MTDCCILEVGVLHWTTIDPPSPLALLWIHAGDETAEGTGEDEVCGTPVTIGMNKLCRDPTVTVSGDWSTLGELQALLYEEGGENEGEVDRDRLTNDVAASVSSASK